MKKPIRVTMVIQDYLPYVGGAEKQLASLSPLLKERNVEISVVTRKHRGFLSFEIINQLPVYRIPIFPPKALASLMYTVLGVKIIRKIGPDLIHAHGLLSPTTTAILGKHLLKIPVVSKPLTGGIVGDLFGLQKKLLGKHRIAAFQKNVDALICISSEIKKELVEAGFAEDRCIFIPNGVDLNRYKPVTEIKKQALRKRLKLPSGIIVLFVGRLEIKKRVDLLIKLWRQVIEKHSTANLIILGTGSLESYLRSIAGKRVHFVGFADDVLPYLQSADIFTLPSIGEGLSNALLEAMAVGLPSLVTPVGGAEDIITHKKSGWFISPDDPKELLEGLLSLIGSSSLRENLGKEGHKQVVEKYSLVATANSLRMLYDRMLETQFRG